MTLVQVCLNGGVMYTRQIHFYNKTDFSHCAKRITLVLELFLQGFGLPPSTDIIKELN